MTSRVVVIGAGMGGLTAAIRLRKAGFDVVVMEARSEPGGLASGVQYDEFSFDAGPYILLDHPGLEWALEKVDLQLENAISLQRIQNVYEVEWPTGGCVRFYSDIEKTAAGFDSRWPGSGRKYCEFVGKVEEIYRSLWPMLLQVPNKRALFRTGAWRNTPFLMRSLGSILASADLPGLIREAVAIWTHVAGQTTDEAPSPLAFVPTLIHSVGAYYPRGGIREIPKVLARAAVAAGVSFQYSTKVTQIHSEYGTVKGVETSGGEFIDAAAVLSNSAALNTYLHLLKGAPRDDLKKLPLQSPGVCAYLAVKGDPGDFYLRFRLDENNKRCRLLLKPATLNSSEPNGWWPARLIAPTDYAEMERAGAAGQHQLLEGLLHEDWWKDNFSEVRVLGKRTPQLWGMEYSLYANSMNPVMTTRFMRQGRIAHRSPYVRGLYLAGSSTHPGQWVSFCAISGVLAADCIIEDLN